MNKLKLKRSEGLFKNEILAVTHTGRVVMTFGDWATIEDIREVLLDLQYELVTTEIPQ